MGIPAVALATVAAIGKSVADIASTENQKKAIDLQKKQTLISAQQKSMANMDLMEKVIASNQAQAGGKGVALSSPSLNAIERGNYNKSAKAGQNIELEKNFELANLETEKKNVNATLFSKLFGNAAQTAMNYKNFFDEKPKAG